MFTYAKFAVDIVRHCDVSDLGWPEPGEAAQGRGLGCNREYVDLRGRSWAEAKRVFALEGELIARVENAEDGEEELTLIDDELYENPDDDLFGLDLGVVSSVVCLSAAKCVPFTSCNAGSFGGRHHARARLVHNSTSANLSGNAMAINMELGVCIHGGPLPEQVERHFDDLISRGDLQVFE